MLGRLCAKSREGKNDGARIHRRLPLRGGPLRGQGRTPLGRPLPLPQLPYSAGAPAGFASSPGVTRSFCARCGTPLTYESEHCPGEVHLYISTLDRPEDFEPQIHVFFAEKIPWFDTADHLPRYAGLSRDGTAPVAGFDSEAFLDRFAEVWQNHDLEGVAGTFTEDAVFEASFGPEAHGERAVGKDAAVRLAASVFERIPDVRFAPIRRFATPDFAVVEQVQAGTPRGGEPLLTLRDGKIAAKRTYRKARRS
jgi:ketosteroid isomerase-like protein